MEKYYSVENLEELEAEISAVEDVVKYLFNIPLDNPDSKYRTPELMSVLEDLALCCEDFLTSYKYYLERENYLCPTRDAMVRRGLNYLNELREEIEEAAEGSTTL